MKKLLKWLVGILVVLGLAVWFGVPALVGTSWAKEKVQESLAESTGRDVELGSISFSWGSGLTVTGVTVKQMEGDRDEDGPLFTLGDLKLDVGFGDLLKKKLTVEEFTVREPVIVIVRDRFGRFNFSDLIETAAVATEPPPPEPDDAPPEISARLDIEDGRILFIDEKLGTRVEAKGIDAKATWARGKLDLDLGLELNGGAVKFKANADLSQERPPFRIEEFTIDGAELDANLAQLGLFIPLLGDRPKSASGKLEFELRDVEGTGFELDQLTEIIRAKGRVRLEGGSLASGAVSELYSAFKAIGAKDLGALSAAEGGGEGISVKLMSGTFSLEAGKVKTKDLKLSAKGMDLTISGWTSLSGEMKYELTAGKLEELVRKNKKVAKYLGEGTTLPLTLSGTLSAPKIDVDVAGALEGAIEKGAARLIDERLGGLFGDDKKKR